MKTLFERLLRQLLLLLHQENVDKDIDPVGCVSLRHSINFLRFSLMSNPSMLLLASRSNYFDASVVGT